MSNNRKDYEFVGEFEQNTDFNSYDFDSNNDELSKYIRTEFQAYSSATYQQPQPVAEKEFTFVIDPSIPSPVYVYNYSFPQSTNSNILYNLNDAEVMEQINSLIQAFNQSGVNYVITTLLNSLSPLIKEDYAFIFLVTYYMGVKDADYLCEKSDTYLRFAYAGKDACDYLNFRNESLLKFIQHIAILNKNDMNLINNLFIQQLDQKIILDLNEKLAEYKIPMITTLNKNPSPKNTRLTSNTQVLFPSTYDSLNHASPKPKKHANKSPSKTKSRKPQPMVIDEDQSDDTEQFVKLNPNNFETTFQFFKAADRLNTSNHNSSTETSSFDKDTNQFDKMCDEWYNRPSH